MHISNFENVLRKLVSLKGITDGDLRVWWSGGEAPRRWATFCNFFGKKSYFNTIESHLASGQSHLKALDFIHLKAISKN